MHLLLLFLLLGQTKQRFGQENPPAKPVDYNIAVHVQSSKLTTECWSDNKGSLCSRMQVLHVVIQGKTYDIERAAENVFRPGDYKARIVSEKTPRTEEYTREYEILLSDGKTAKFGVVGQSE